MQAALGDAFCLFVAFFLGFVAASQVAAEMLDVGRWMIAAAALAAGTLTAWRFPRARRLLLWAGAGALSYASVVGLFVLNFAL